jgi:LAO/AO transport system kinase
VPVIATQAVNEIGIDELLQAIEKHHQALEQNGHLTLKRRQQRKKELFQAIEHKLMAQVVGSIEKDMHLTGYVEKVESGELDPYSAAEEILATKRQ